MNRVAETAPRLMNPKPSSRSCEALPSGLRKRQRARPGQLCPWRGELSPLRLISVSNASVEGDFPGKDVANEAGTLKPTDGFIAVFLSSPLLSKWARLPLP